LKWSVVWFLNVDPSEPTPWAVKVNVPFTVFPFWLNPPHTVKWPVKLGRLGSSRGSATKVPVLDVCLGDGRLG
jgi:hypothetical protein